MQNDNVKIDRWYALSSRIFRDYPWIQQMYVAHNIAAISNYSQKREIEVLSAHRLEIFPSFRPVLGATFDKAM